MRKQKHIAIYNPYLETRGGGEKVCLAMAEHFSKHNKVTIVSRSTNNLEELGRYFDLDLSRCNHIVLPGADNLATKASRKLRASSRLNNLIHDFFDYRTLKSQNYDVFINNCYKSGMPNPAPVGIYMCMFPQEFDHKRNSLLKRVYHLFVDSVELLLYRKSGLSLIRTYQHITANSSYTKHWISKLWGLDSEITTLLPICEDMGSKKHHKQKIILNVGRFFADSGENHYKCQDKLLSEFAAMTDLHELGWELHFAGSVPEDADSLGYVLSLIKKSRGLPVHIHMDLPFTELKKLFRETSIYWHATGWGSDPDRHPEKQEHFGITTVEAMSAGAVPVVIDSAGQKETVVHGESGLLWSSSRELQEYTRSVATNDELRKGMSAAAVKRAKQFNKSSFAETLEKILPSA